MRTLFRAAFQAVGVGVLINLFACLWSFLAPQTIPWIPRYMIAPGFALAWHTPGGQGEQLFVLMGVNLVLWSLLAFPFLLASSYLFRGGGRD